jgi:hypothetical protein
VLRIVRESELIFFEEGEAFRRAEFLAEDFLVIAGDADGPHAALDGQPGFGVTTA